MPPRYPACPLCGGTDLAVLSTTDKFRSAKPEEGERPIGVMYFFKCQCGLTFTHIASHELQKSPEEAAVPNHVAARFRGRQ